MLFALQNGSYGSRLFSSDYTPQENMRMVFSLANKRYHLLCSSVDRYERMNHTYQDIMREISKRMNSKDFPDTILPLHSLQSLQDAIRLQWGSLISAFNAMEQINSSYIDSFYACSSSTNALSQELEVALRLRLYLIVVYLLVRQVAQSHDPSTPIHSPKKYRSSSADSVGSDESISCGGPALLKPLKPALRCGQGRKQIPIRIPCVRERHRRLSQLHAALSAQ